MRLRIMLSALLLISPMDSALADASKLPVLKMTCRNANAPNGEVVDDVTKFYSTKNVAISPSVQFDVTRESLGPGAVRVDRQNAGICRVNLVDSKPGNPRFKLVSGNAVMRGQNGSSGTSVASSRESDAEIKFTVTTPDFFLGHTVAIYEFEIAYAER